MPGPQDHLVLKDHLVLTLHQELGVSPGLWVKLVYQDQEGTLVRLVRGVNPGSRDQWVQ